MSNEKDVNPKAKIESGSTKNNIRDNFNSVDVILSNKNESLSETEALGLMSSTNPKIQKGRDMFYSIFKTQLSNTEKEVRGDNNDNREGDNNDNISDDISVNYKFTPYAAAELSLKISSYIFREHPSSFPKVVRDKVHSLKENSDLTRRLYSHALRISHFVELTAADMKSEKQKETENRIIEESVNASKMAQVQAETTMFTCGRCKSNKCTYYQLQTRSCDEPMTTFVRCTGCGHNWKF